MATTLLLLELRATEPSLGKPRVDRAAGVIRGVRVLGLSSTNGLRGSKRTRYSRRALDGAVASGIYEGKQVFLDHPNRENPKANRSYKDRLGRLKNVTVDEGGLRADLHVNKGHPHAAQLLDDAENDPAACGLSHNADGAGGHEGDEFVIEEIKAVRSVDVVTEPATTHSLFEERTMPEADEKKPETGSTTTTAVEDRKPETDRLSLLEQRLDQLLEQGKAKDKKIDDLTVELESRKRAERVEKLLESAKLPKHAVTPLLKKQLAEAKDEAAEKELLEERKRLAFHQVPGNPAAPSADAGAAIETSDAFLEAVDATKQRKGR